jgi:hypothetical protein
MGLTKAALTMANLAAPQAQVATGCAIVYFFLQSGLDQLVLPWGSARKAHIGIQKLSP